MRCTFAFTWAAALVGAALGRPSALAAADGAVAYYDQETGFQFSEFKAAYSLTANIVYRIAVPSDAPAGAGYDVVLQVVAPNQVGWAGLAWGGSMIKNPLTVAWANGQKATISSRYATGHSLPAAYTGAAYQLLTTGTHSNGTHWQYTAKCAGCTYFTGSSGSVRLNPTGSNRLAFAYAATKPSNPSSNSSSFSVHDVFNYWSHDFSSGQNPNFASLVQKNA